MHKQFVPRLVSIVTAMTVIMWVSAVALPSAQRSETEGIKEAENFVSAGSDTVGAVGKARVQIEKTLAAYNSLVTQPTKDMKGDYKKLMSGAKDTDERVDEARERVTKMEAAGDTYFAGREAAIKEIQSQDLRDKARQREQKAVRWRKGVASGCRPVAPDAADRSEESDHLSWERSDAQCDDLAEAAGAEVQRSRHRGTHQGRSDHGDSEQVLRFNATNQVLISVCGSGRPWAARSLSMVRFYAGTPTRT